MPDGRRSWTVLDDRGDIVECVRRWIVHLEQTHAAPNTIRAYVRHVVAFANFLSANDAGLHQATVPLYDGFLAWRLALVACRGALWVRRLKLALRKASCPV